MLFMKLQEFNDKIKNQRENRNSNKRCGNNSRQNQTVKRTKNRKNNKKDSKGNDEYSFKSAEILTIEFVIYLSQRFFFHEIHPLFVKWLRRGDSNPNNQSNNAEIRPCYAIPQLSNHGINGATAFPVGYVAIKGCYHEDDNNHYYLTEQENG